MTYQNVRAAAQNVDTGANSSVFQNVAGASLSCWFSLDSVSAAIRQLNNASTGASANVPRLALGIGTATPRVSARRLDADVTTNLTGGSVTAGSLHHLAATAAFSSQVLTLYLDGVPINTVVIAGWTGNSSNTASLVSSLASLAGNTFDGRVCDSRRYQRVLSDAEIQTLFTARGRDGNVFGGVDRWMTNERGPGQTVLACVDKWIGSQPASPVNAPVYADWIAYPRRRRRR